MRIRLLTALDRALGKVDAGLVFLAVLCLCCIGILTTLDVAMRYMFNSPFTFAFDLTSMYLFPASVLLILADVNRRNENIDIDLFSRRFTLRQWRLASLMGNASAGAVFALIAWLYLQKTIHALVTGESTFGAIMWPLWPAMAIAATGFAGLSLSILARCLQHILGTSARPAAHQSAE